MHTLTHILSRGPNSTRGTIITYASLHTHLTLYSHTYKSDVMITSYMCSHMTSCDTHLLSGTTNQARCSISAINTRLTWKSLKHTKTNHQEHNFLSHCGCSISEPLKLVYVKGCGGVVGCLLICALHLLFLHFFLLFLSQYCLVIYARDCSCTCRKYNRAVSVILFIRLRCLLCFGLISIGDLNSAS